jgi:hypothetical protein
MKIVTINGAIIVLFNAILFFTFFGVTTPLFNSSDNVFCLYLLGGGFGQAPTELIYYNHLLHPVITIAIKKLFVLDPYVNWYSVILIFFQFIASSAIAVRLISGKSLRIAILVYSLFFIVFQSYFLLSLSFTNTSIILTIAAILILGPENPEKMITLRESLYVIALFIFASLFRIHIIILLVGMCLPFFILFQKIKNIIRTFFIIVIASFFICLGNYIHQKIYTNSIPNWVQDEQYRQHLYSLFNDGYVSHNVVTNWQTEQGLLKYALIIDTNFLGTNKLIQIQKDLHKKRNLESKNLDNSNSFKWFIINNRIFFGCFFSLLLFCKIDKQYISVVLISFLCLVTGCLILFYFVKLPDYVFLSGLGLLCLLISFKPLVCTRYSLLYCAKLGVVFFFIFWGVIRIWKENKKNIVNNRSFKLAVAEVEKYPRDLFFVTDYSFPLDYVSVFDVPQKYPLNNVILGWHYSYSFSLEILKKFNISSVQKLPYASNVLLWGKPVQELLDYYSKSANMNLEYSNPLPEFKYGEVRRFHLKEK